MKFVRFKKGNMISYGAIGEGYVQRIKGDIFKKYEITNELYKINEIKLLTPCVPSRIIAVGLNYKDHIIEMKHDMPDEPVIFMKASTAVVGPEARIIIPKNAGRIEYEAEVGLVIGKPVKNVEPEIALDYILGVTCFNDVTARELQKKDGQWTRAKSYDTFAPIGPCIASGLDYNNIDIELILNGEIKQKSNTSNCLFSAAYILSFISKIMPMFPGDIIATGTPSGVGTIKKGDIVEVKLSGVGTLRNYVE